MTEKAKNPVRAGKRILKVVEILERKDRARVSEVAQEVDFSKSTVHNYLSTLRENGYVIKEGDLYRLSLRFLEIGENTRYNTRLYQFGREQADQLANSVGELVNLTTEEKGQVVYLYRVQGTKDVNFSTRVGRRADMHYTAAGKAMLAFSRDEYVEEVLEKHGLPGRSENTITDREGFYKELDEVRESGIALDREEYGDGLRCMAAPIVGRHNEVLGSISVSAPTTRLENNEFERQTEDQLREAANVIELNIREY